MRRVIFVYSALFFLAFNLEAQEENSQVSGTPLNSLEVTVTDVDSSEGFLAWSLYNKAECFYAEGGSECPAFAENLGITRDGQKVEGGVLAENSDGVVKFSIPNLPDGEYSLTIYHDKDLNGRHNRGFMKMPKEDFGISGIKDTLWHSPKWDEVKFIIKGGGTQKIDIPMLWYRRRPVDF